ncbi:Gldg family protein [Erythrobacter litoralis]|uniref:ABC-type uncharacterized transport system domain-containing protein n=1 Tax=Erythrobacter litoralis (strain HTCC2594) TaxID=314225 RepID=Q2ND01_ERYLH|nr:Gldg family protein [Erythrobacter litoralis]ABC62440.1 hypothetical protein ELI_01740 [Erythrobacter litoralis HTCC2594]
MRCRASKLFAAVLPPLALLFAGCSRPAEPPVEDERLTIGLMSSLPVYWSGGNAFVELSQDGVEPHWARMALEAAHDLEAIDALTSENLARTDLLILAQPRVLSPMENVALDDWVRAGGKALVFADPALVLESEFPLGDPRRPMDTVLLSPILARWGLELMFDPAQAEALRRVRDGDVVLDVAAAGTFEVSGGEGSSCTLAAEGVLATCAIGEGRVVLVADATLLEDTVGTEASAGILSALIARTSDPVREITGRSGK